MKIAVTGATGNLGTALIRRLLATGEATTIRGLARRLPDADAGPTSVSGSPDTVGGGDRVQWTHVDLTSEACLPTLQAAFRGVDAVVHLAWGFQPTHAPAYLEELGVGGTRRVIEAATAENVTHLVHMSSVGAYSPKVDDRPVDEGHPTDGIATSMYSRHKAAAERLLDHHEVVHLGSPSRRSAQGPQITRLRPGIVGQHSAGSALSRYGLPGLIPARAIRLLPVLPLDRRLVVPMIHADDVADAIYRVISRQAFGAFNLAAPEPVTPPLIGAALGAKVVHVPASALRGVVDGTWRARVQPLDPGWIDLAMNVPLLDTSRAQDELEWSPTHSTESVLTEVVEGMRSSAAGTTPVLRPRSVAGNLRDLVRRGPITRRREP